MSIKQTRKTSTPASKTAAAASTTHTEPATSNEATVADGEREVYLRQAQAVVDQSNENAANGTDKVWLEQNGGNVGVAPDNGKKPDEWKNGIYAADGGFGYVHDAKDTGIANLEEFRKQITADLNYNGVFDEYESSKAFESAVASQYGGSTPERKEQVRAIALNLWSYATVGADLEGNTNVSELQGLLYSLDPLIAEASASNTKHENTFTIPGTNLELDSGGDDLYGRATMLECRLLSSVLKEKAPPASEVEKEEELPPLLQSVPETEKENKPPVDDDVFGRTHFIMDISASMYNDHKMLSEYFNEVDFGDTSIGGMTSHYSGVNWHGATSGDDAIGAPVSMDEGRDMMGGLARLNLDRKSTSEKKDKAEGISNAFDGLGKGNEESSIETAYQMILKMKNENIAVDQTKGEQIVIATDEKDSFPKNLHALRDMANEMGILVKVLLFTTKGMFEIRINDITDDLLDKVDSEVNGPQPTFGTSAGGRATQADNYNDAYREDNALTLYEKNDDFRSSGDFHLALSWTRLAAHMGLLPIGDMKDRQSRRVTN